jgi:hypothetical protein
MPWLHGRARSFLFRARNGAGQAPRPEDGENPAGNDSRIAILPSRSVQKYRLPRTPDRSLTKEPVMGIIAWVVVGLVRAGGGGAIR